MTTMQTSATTTTAKISSSNSTLLHHHHPRRSSDRTYMNNDIIEVAMRQHVSSGSRITPIMNTPKIEVATTTTNYLMSSKLAANFAELKRLAATNSNNNDNNKRSRVDDNTMDDIKNPTTTNYDEKLYQSPTVGSYQQRLAEETALMAAEEVLRMQNAVAELEAMLADDNSDPVNIIMPPIPVAHIEIIDELSVRTDNNRGKSHKIGGDVNGNSTVGTHSPTLSTTSSTRSSPSKYDISNDNEISSFLSSRSTPTNTE